MSVIGFADTADLEAKVAKVAADHNMTLNAVDSAVAARRLASAYQIVLGALIDRGLSKAQADTWARGEEFQLDIATYWYGCDSGWNRMQRDDQDWLRVFKREEELATVKLLDADGEPLGESGVAAAVWDITE
jgi:hypothetical protein